MRVIDFADVKNPKEVALAGGEFRADANSSSRGRGRRFYDGGRYLHDLQIIDGLAYLRLLGAMARYSDVGNGIKGGSSEHPQFVSTYRFKLRRTIRLRLACGRARDFPLQELTVRWRRSVSREL